MQTTNSKAQIYLRVSNLISTDVSWCLVTSSILCFYLSYLTFQVFSFTGWSGSSLIGIRKDMVSRDEAHVTKDQTQDKTRQDKIYFESARHIHVTVNVSSRELLNRLFENKCIELTYVQQLQQQFVIFKHQR